MAIQYFCDLSERRLPATIGNKAVNLRRLSEKRFHIPPTRVCTWEAYQRYTQGDPTVLDEVSHQLGEFAVPEKAYSVRSSANIEDSFEYSFAGQFKSCLDLRGLPAILAAIQAVWEQTNSSGVHAYLQRLPADRHDLKMAVIVQDMVAPQISGVTFSRNPLTGLDEIVVEAIRGSGEALVQEGVTPQRWIYKWGEWIYQPEFEDIPQGLLLEVVDQTAAIRKAFKQEVDLEWVYDGSELYWVQMREITSFGEQAVYSNKISKDVLPGIIKPLIWSVNTPIVNGTWVKLLEEVIGDSGIDPASLTKAFYYRTYFNMGAFGRVFERLGMPDESLEMMIGLQTEKKRKFRFKLSPQLMSRLPRMVRFGADKWNFSRKIDRSLPELEAGYRDIARDRPDALDDRRLLDDIARLKDLTKRTAYLNIVGPLLMSIYNGMLRRQMKKQGLDYERLDLMHGVEEIRRFDPGYHLERLSQQFNQLSPSVQEQIRQGSYAGFQRTAGIEDFQSEVVGFVEQFGHLSDSGNDFSSVPWRENPDLILQMIANYASTGDSGAGKEGSTEKEGGRKLLFSELPVKGVRRWQLERLYRRARQYRLYREHISSVYTFGYGLFRDFYLSLGDLLVQRGILGNRQDIFYLYEPEVWSIIDGERGSPDYAALVQQRKREIEQVRDVELPGVIFGDQPPPIHTDANQVLRGTPTSRGYYTGPVKNVCGIGDFPKVEAGDVLVVPYSDVGWTPLFAHAGAVIAASGGILSHSSIVAREYNIPAVVSVDGVSRLRDHMLVTVDGYRGEILLHKEV